MGNIQIIDEILKIIAANVVRTKTKSGKPFSIQKRDEAIQFIKKYAEKYGFKNYDDRWKELEVEERIKVVEGVLAANE